MRKNSDAGEVRKELKKAKRNTILLALFAVIVLVLVFLAFYYGRKLGKTEKKLVEEKPVVTQDVLYQQLEGIGELNTVRYYYTNMGRYENSLVIGDTQLPLTKKSFIISYDGIIKAGVVLSDIKFELKGKRIVVHIPKAKILSHETDEDSVQVFDEKNSIFNGLSTEDVTGFLGGQKKIMEEKAVSNGILDEARENTKDSLKTIYGVLLKDESYEKGYTLEFVED